MNSRKLLTILVPAAVLIPVTLSLSLSALGAGLVLAAALAGATGLLASFLLLRSLQAGLLGPMERGAAMTKKFMAAGSRLDSPMPREGWKEAGDLIASLNRLMLELSAFRAFHLNQVVEERAKAAALIETIMDGVLLLDDRGQLIYANQLALRLLGVAGLDPGVPLLPAVTRSAFVPALEGILASPEVYLEEEVDLPGGEDEGEVARSFRVISRQFFLATLKKPGRVVVLRDVTAEKEIESSRETFFHMVTHDMRAPLTSIQGYAQMITREAPSTPGLKKCLGAIQRSSWRLSGMIADILNMMKLERGEMVLQRAPLDAAALCSRVFELHEPLAARKNIRFSVLPAEGVPAVSGDPDLLERVLTNLVGNSLKFTPEGGAVSVSCREESGGALFCVEDDGPGVPEEKREEIFRKHSQLEDYRYMGFGLGLAMCRMAVELHGGRIWMEPGKEKGSRFKFTVPAGRPDGEDTHS